MDNKQCVTDVSQQDGKMRDSKEVEATNIKPRRYVDEGVTKLEAKLTYQDATAPKLIIDGWDKGEKEPVLCMVDKKFVTEAVEVEKITPGQPSFSSGTKFVEIVGRGLVVDHDIVRKREGFFFSIKNWTEDKMQERTEQSIKIDYGNKQRNIMEWHTYLDSRQLLQKNKKLRGSTLRFYRCLLLKQDRERSMQFKEWPQKWIPSYIHSTDFCDLLSRNSRAAKNKKPFFLDKLRQERDLIPGKCAK